MTSWPRRASICIASPRCCSATRWPGGAVGHQVDQRLIAGMGCQPVAVEPGVEQPGADRPSFVGVEGCQFVQRIGRVARSPGRRAEQRQTLDAFGHRHGELLGDHPAEADAHHRTGVPTDVVDEPDRVRRVVGHRRRSVRDRRATQPALVVSENLEIGAEQPDQRRHGLERGAGSVQEQQPRSVPTELVVDVDPADVRGGHDGDCRTPRSFRPIGASRPDRSAGATTLPRRRPPPRGSCGRTRGRRSRPRRPARRGPSRRTP